MARYARGLSPGGGCALDIGAGQEVSAYALARAGYRVTAIEPDPSELVGCGAIAQLGEICDGIVNVVQGVAEALPFGPASFDLVYCRQALHHARDVRKFCEEAARVLKPGGTFIAAREHVISSERDLPRFLENHLLHRLYGGECAYRSAFYLSAMKSAGFGVMRVIRSFDSSINYSPLTASLVGAEIESRVRRLPGAARLVRWLGSSATGMRLLLRALSLADRRPGRLNSFLCVKLPESRSPVGRRPFKVSGSPALTVRVAFPLLGGAAWTGGHNYLRNLFQVLAMTVAGHITPVLMVPAGTPAESRTAFHRNRRGRGSGASRKPRPSPARPSARDTHRPGRPSRALAACPAHRSGIRSNRFHRLAQSEFPRSRGFPTSSTSTCRTCSSDRGCGAVSSSTNCRPVPGEPSC